MDFQHIVSWSTNFYTSAIFKPILTNYCLIYLLGSALELLILNSVCRTLDFLNEQKCGCAGWRSWYNWNLCKYTLLQTTFFCPKIQSSEFEFFKSNSNSNHLSSQILGQILDFWHENSNMSKSQVFVKIEFLDINSISRTVCK